MWPRFAHQIESFTWIPARIKLNLLYGFDPKLDLLSSPNLHFFLWLNKTHAHMLDSSSILSHTTKHPYKWCTKNLMNGFTGFISCWNALSFPVGMLFSLFIRIFIFKLSGQEICVKYLLSLYLHVYFWETFWWDSLWMFLNVYFIFPDNCKRDQGFPLCVWSQNTPKFIPLILMIPAGSIWIF